MSIEACAASVTGSAEFLLKLNAFARDMGARALLALMAVVGAQSWSGQAIAQVPTGCELVATGGITSVSGLSGSTQTLSFDIVDYNGGCPPTVSTVTSAVVSDTTAGSGIVSGSSQALTPGTYSIQVELGPNDGSVEVLVQCPDCTIGTPTLNLYFYTNNVYGLSLISPADGTHTARPGESITLEVKAFRNANEPVSGSNIYWDVAPTDFAIPGPVSTAADGHASVTFSHSPSATTVYTVTARYCDPAAGCDGDITNSFAVTIGEWQLLTTTDPFSFPAPYTYDIQPSVQVDLRDAAGDAIPGINIAWMTSLAGSYLTPASGPTDGSGRAQTVVTTGATSGSLSVTAEVPGKPVSNVINFLSVSPISSPSITINSGNNQSGNQGATLPLSVMLRNDAGRIAVGAPVSWSVLAGGDATIPASTNSVLDGTASNTVTLGNTAGPIQVQANFLGATVVFNLTVNDDYALTATTPTNVTAGVGETVALGTRYLVNGLPATSSVNWSASGGSLGSTAVLPNASTGDADNTFSVATPGTYTITASGGCPTATPNCPPPPVEFTVTVVDRALLGGGSNSGLPGQAFLLTVRAEDNGVPVAGRTIQWTVSGDGSLSAASSTTDAAGEATVTVTLGNTIGSTVSVLATRADEPAATASFGLDIIGPDIAKIAGDGQSGLAGTDGDIPLEIFATGPGNAPASGEVVSWSVSMGDIVLGSSTTTTDSSGHSSLPFRFGSTLGPAKVRASVRGGQSVDFDLEVLGGNIVPGGGNGQSGAIGEPLPDPLVVRVSGSGAPAAFAKSGAGTQGLAGVPVHWVVTSGGGSVSASDTFTDANGESSVIFTLGPAPGTHSVTATMPGGTTVFTATAFIPTGVLTIISGDEQTLPTNTESEPLVVELRTEDGEPLAGVAIEWSTENAELDANSTETDVNGRAQVVAKVLEPGAATVTAVSTNPDAAPVTFTLNGAVANLDNLDPIEEQVAEVVDLMCPALAAIPNPTPEQQDLLQRCLEIVDAAGLDPDATIAALNEWFEELVQAQSDATLIALQSQLQNLQGRLAALRGGNPGNGFAGLTLLGPGGSVPLVGMFKAMAGDEGNDLDAAFSRWGWFVTGSIGRGEFDPTSSTPAFDYDINGLTSGIDYRVNDNFIVGGSLGYTAQDTDARDGSGSLETRGWSLSGYGSWFNEHNWYIDGVLTWGRNDYRSLRTIQYTLPLIGGGTVEIDQLARGSSDGDQLQTAFTVGRDFQKGAWNLGTYGRLLYSRVSFGESREVLQEGPGSGLGLAVRSRDLTSLATVLGGKASYAYSAAWGVLMPSFELEWERETKDDPAMVEAYFIHDPTQSPIVITGSAMDRSFFRLGFGLSMLFTNGRSGFVYYERLAGRTGQSQENLSLGFRLEF